MLIPTETPRKSWPNRLKQTSAMLWGLLIAAGCFAMMAAPSQAIAQVNTTYTIKVKTDGSSNSGTRFRVNMYMIGENNQNSGWFRLKGDHGKGKETNETYTIRDIGPIKYIYVENDRPSGLIHGDDWKVQWVEVSRPNGLEPDVSRFSLGLKLSANKRSGAVLRDATKRAELIKKDPKPIETPGERVSIVKFFANHGGSGEVSANNVSETWSTENAVTFAKSTTKEFNASITAGYSYDSVVAGEFSAEATVGFSTALSQERSETNSQGYERTIEWSFPVPAGKAVINESIVRVPKRFVKYTATKTGEIMIVRKPGGKARLTTGSRIEIPQFDPTTGKVIPVPLSSIERMVKHMDEDTLANFKQTMKQWNWEGKGWVRNDLGGRPLNTTATPSTPTTPSTRPSNGTSGTPSTTVQNDSSGIPAEALKQIALARSQGHKIKRLAFAPNGGWSLIYGKNGYFNRNIPDEAHQKMGEFAKAGYQLKSIAFTAKGGWSLLYGDNGSYNRGVPAEAHAKMGELSRAGHTLTSVAFTPTGGWSLIYGKNGYFNRNIPDEAHQKMGEFARGGHELKSIAFTPSGGWSVIYGKNGYFNRNTGNAPHAATTKLFQQGREMTAVSYTYDGGWIVIHN